MTRRLIVVLALAAAGCSWSPFGVDDHRIYLCSGDTDCGDGMHCVSGRCAPLGSGTGGGGGGGGMGGGCQQTGAESCTDGSDNDCDGDTDCADSDCASKRCDLALPLFCSGGMCTCTGDAGLPAEMNCSDNKDNDCNQLTDCQDPNCVGKACSATGKVCQPNQACICSGNGGPVQTPETSCLDTFDNDCDGLTDCQDADCNGVSCGPHGIECNAQSGMCRCGGNGGTPEASEGSCSDQFDNDCDGNTDCFDSDCGGGGCGPNGRKCNGSMCLCAGNGGAVEVTEMTCNDNADNDCNSRSDCGEPFCNGASCGAHGKKCINGGCACGGNGGTVEASEATCGDTVDNDCDGNADCSDTDCGGKKCSATKKVCQGTACTCTGAGGTAQANEISCNDGFDNDCDGLTDCADPTCANMACGGPGAKCSGMTCTCFLAGGSMGMVVETNCSNGGDDDCDNLVDCHDPDCNGQACAAGGHCCAAVDGGSCVNLSTSAANCGGCGLACQGAFPSCNSGVCPCGGVSGGCPMGQTCTSVFGGVCQCANASQCAMGEFCTNMACSYP